MSNSILNSKILTYVLIGVILVLIILIIVLSIALCRIKRKNKKAKEEKIAKRARKVKTREIIKQNSINNSQYSLVDYCEKDQDLNEENNKNNVNKSFNSSIYKKPNLSSTDSFMRHQMNITELDIPTNALAVDSLNLSLINNKDYSIRSPSGDINSEINDLQINNSNIENKSVEPDRTKNNTDSVIATSIPGNNTVGRDNVREIPSIHDSDNLLENSYQSSRSHTSASQQLLIQHPYISYLKSLDSQNLLDMSQLNIEINSRNSQVGSSFENLNALDQKSDDDGNYNNDISNNHVHTTIPKSPKNLFYKTPLSPIMSSSDEEDSIPVHNVNGRNSTSYAENLTNVNKSNVTFDETLNQSHHANKTPGRAVSYDDYLLYHNKSINSIISSSASRSYILRSASNISTNTVNTNISRNLYSSNNKSHLSSVLSHNEEEVSSVLTEGTSVISVENIVPNVRRSLRMSHLQERAPEMQKVEINLSIDDIPEDVDINDEVEEDVFMRPSMMRFVEVEPSPVLQLEAQTTRISFISNQSSPIILDNISNSSSCDGHISSDEKNEGKKNSNNKINPSPKEIIIKIDDNKKNSDNDSNSEIDIVEKGHIFNSESEVPIDSMVIENKK